VAESPTAAPESAAGAAAPVANEVITNFSAPMTSGQTFELSAETYHGAGGKWTPGR